ncbi:F0F1 ATP synthase subunit A, partial [Agrobacterium sp. S2]|nr:F0F1 ATP synthase subunit A [Agrobacterium sp. S2]
MTHTWDRPPAPSTYRRLLCPALRRSCRSLPKASPGSTSRRSPSSSPPAIWFEGTVFEINRIQLVRFVAVAVLLTLMVIAARRARLVPRRGQNMAEFLLDFVRVNVAEDIIGKEKAGKYVALLTTIFFAIFAFNITGVVPGLNIAGTSLIGLPVMLALWVYVMYLGAGVSPRRRRVPQEQPVPPGCPAVLYVLLTPVEFLQVFVLRPLTLAIRLMANMVAGHLMLVLCFSATQFLLFEASGGLKPFG